MSYKIVSSHLSTVAIVENTICYRHPTQHVSIHTQDIGRNCYFAGTAAAFFAASGPSRWFGKLTFDRFSDGPCEGVLLQPAFSSRCLPFPSCTVFDRNKDRPLRPLSLAAQHTIPLACGYPTPQSLPRRNHSNVWSEQRELYYTAMDLWNRMDDYRPRPPHDSLPLRRAHSAHSHRLRGIATVFVGISSSEHINAVELPPSTQSFGECIYVVSSHWLPGAGLSYVCTHVAPAAADQIGSTSPSSVVV